MKLTFLGTSSGVPSKQRNVSGCAVSFDNTKDWLLVDCGEATQHQLLHTELSPYRLSAILITHLHGDHCYGLPGLLASMAMAKKQAPLTLVAPEKVIAFVKATITYTELTLPFELIFIALETLNSRLELAFAYIDVVSLKHRVPSVGFKITERLIPRKLALAKLKNDNIESGSHYNLLQKGQDVTHNGQRLKSSDYSYSSWPPRKVVICGDNEKPSLLSNYITDIDALVHEATFTHADLRGIEFNTGHSDAKRIAEFAEQHQIKSLVLTHFSSRYHGEGMLDKLAEEAARYYSGKLILANDLMVLEIEKRAHFK